MNITLYRNSSESNKVNKTITQILSVDGSLKDETSILNPTFIVNNVGVINANYCYIPQFNRYYFITDITSYRNNLWQISCKVDVLMTYKSQILENTATLSRQENLHNLYLKDDLSKFESDTFTLYQDFPTQNFNGSGDFLILTTG